MYYNSWLTIFYKGKLLYRHKNTAMETVNFPLWNFCYFLLIYVVETDWYFVWFKEMTKNKYICISTTTIICITIHCLDPLQFHTLIMTLKEIFFPLYSECQEYFFKKWCFPTLIIILFNCYVIQKYLREKWCFLSYLHQMFISFPTYQNKHQLTLYK